jgi:hypothetical protein
MIKLINIIINPSPQRSLRMSHGITEAETEIKELGGSKDRRNRGNYEHWEVKGK